MITVIYSSPFVPAEWVAAHGVRPRRIRPDPAAALPFTGPLTGVCPYARAFMGACLAAGSADAAVLTTTCDQMRRAAEWLAAGGGPPVFLLNVPATWQTPAAARMYRDELERLGRFLVGMGGKAPSREHLAETLEDYNARREALRGTLGTLTARQASDAIARYDLDFEHIGGCGTAGLASRGESHATCHTAGQASRATLTSVDNRAHPPRGTPVALVGGPLMRGDERVFDIIEQSGGRVVLDGTESGLRTLPAPLQRRRLRDDPLLQLMDAYFGAIPDAFRRPDTALYQWLTRELAASAALPGKGGCTLFAPLRKGDCPLFPEPVRKRGQPPFPNIGKGDSPLFRSPPAAYAARGVIVWRYVWCDMWAASAARLREATGLPVLDLDVSGDASGLDRTAGRIQAFMEVLR